MANKKISQLSATTEANDNVWLVINDSGETTTNKIKRSDLLSGTDVAGGFIQGDASQSLVPYYFPTSSGTTSGTTYVDKLFSVGSKIDSTNNNLNIGNNTLSSGGQYNFVAGGNGNIISTGSESAIVGGQINKVENTATNSIILGGRNGKIQAGNRASILGGFDNKINGGTDGLTIVGGGVNTISAGSYSGIFGGYGNTIPSSGNYNSILGGQTNSIAGGTHSAISSSIGSTANGDTTIDISASYQSDVTGASYRSIIAGTYQSSINAGTGCAVIGTYADITGNGNGYDIIAGGISHTLTSSSYSTILGGQNNTITSSNESALISTNGSLISGGSLNSVVLGGRNTTIGDLDEVIMLGTNNRTSLYSATTHAENIHIYGTESKNTITGQTASGATTIDLSTGSVFEFEMTGNITSITFTNWREGGIYEFVVYNNGSHTITSSGVRLDGVANTIAAKAASINPTNNERTLYRMLIVNGKGYLNEHLNFQFM